MLTPGPPYKLKLDTFDAAQRLFEDWLSLADPTRECLWTAHVDGSGDCLYFAEHQGDECGGAFPLKKIVADALEYHAAGILLAHNHPSGDPRPSASDCQATRRLATAAEALNCRVLDHLIFAGGGCTSFQKLGLL